MELSNELISQFVKATNDNKQTNSETIVYGTTVEYEGKTYVFAMNGQTGKITGTLPVCKKRSAAWFSGISAVVAAFAALVQFLAQM